MGSAPQLDSIRIAGALCLPVPNREIVGSGCLWVPLPAALQVLLHLDIPGTSAQGGQTGQGEVMAWQGAGYAQGCDLCVPALCTGMQMSLLPQQLDSHVKALKTTQTLTNERILYPETRAGDVF